MDLETIKACHAQGKLSPDDTAALIAEVERLHRYIKAVWDWTVKVRARYSYLAPPPTLDRF